MTWGSVFGFFVVIPCGAGTAFALLALLSTFAFIPPYQSMVESAVKVLIGTLLIYGPFWRVLRRDVPIVSGLVFGFLLTILVWGLGNAG